MTRWIKKSWLARTPSRPWPQPGNSWTTGRASKKRTQITDDRENPRSVDAVNAHADELVDRQILHPVRLEAGDVFRCDAMDAHGHKLIRRRIFVTKPFQVFDEFGGNAVDAEGNELIGVRMSVAELL